jgi:hypothetical protein
MSSRTSEQWREIFSIPYSPQETRIWIERLIKDLEASRSECEDKQKTINDLMMDLKLYREGQNW